MHIPDGFIDSKTAAATGVLAVAGLGLALREARLRLPPQRVPLLGLTAAFVFAAQLINFPVAGGTSGHLVGAVLAAVLVGPSPAVIVLSAVLIVQCLMFADGGLSALGANLLNLGLLGVLGGWAVYFVVSRVVAGLFGRILAAAFAAWCSIVLAAIACAGELAVSGTAAWSVVLPAMAGVHMLVGVGEGLITGLVLVAIARVRPELLRPGHSAAPGRSIGTLLAYGGLVTLALALFASPLASSWPDGLEQVAATLGFGDRGRSPVLPAPLPDYEVPGLPWSPLGTSVAAGLGTVAAFGLAWLLARVLVPRGAPGEGGSPRSSAGGAT
jgi:cobalt/nickel transport system permease protein